MRQERKQAERKQRKKRQKIKGKERKKTKTFLADRLAAVVVQQVMQRERQAVLLGDGEERVVVGGARALALSLLVKITSSVEEAFR